MVQQLEQAGVENTEQIAELEEASTQLATELDEVLKTIEESRAKIGAYVAPWHEMIRNTFHWFGRK